MTWGWVFIGEGVLAVVVLGALGLGLVRRVRTLRGEVARLQAALPSSPVPARLAELAATRSATRD